MLHLVAWLTQEKAGFSGCLKVNIQAHGSRVLQYDTQTLKGLCCSYRLVAPHLGQRISNCYLAYLCDGGSPKFGENV